MLTFFGYVSLLPGVSETILGNLLASTPAEVRSRVQVVGETGYGCHCRVDSIGISELSAWGFGVWS
jgi:hypothetical protein